MGKAGQWSASWAWLILTFAVVLYVVVFDVHAYFAHGKTMSGQFHDWIVNPTIGPIIFGVWFGIFVGLTFHWFQYKGK
jgi:hypothetical protein